MQSLNEAGAGLTLEGIWTLVATLEHAARSWMTVYMEPGEQSVGAMVMVERNRKGPETDSIVSTVTLSSIEGRRYRFDVVLHDAAGNLIGRGTNIRAVIATAPAA